jgi:hypothetical protein
MRERMLMRQVSAAACLMLLWTCACHAQTEAIDPTPLLHGEPLTVWVLRPGHAPKTPAGIAALVPPTPRLGFQEQTAGSFGQTASSAGQNAASYGTAASNVGTAASNAGQNAGGYGTTASDAGQNAASYGIAASNYGTAASNLGTAASNVGTAASSYGHLASETGPNTAEERRGAAATGRNMVLDRVRALMLTVRETNIRYIELYAEEFKARIEAANKTGDLPDVLIGSLPNTQEYLQLQARLFLPSTVYGEIADDNLGAAAQGFPGRGMWRQDFAVFLRAPHPRAARAFALVMAEGKLRLPVQFASDDERSAPTLVAIDAMSRLASGEAVGAAADPLLAEFTLQQAQARLVGVAMLAEDTTTPRLEALAASVNGGLAVVELRVSVSSEKSLELMHPLVVLQQAADGSWKVLQVTLNLPMEEQHDEAERLMDTSTRAEESKAGVKGVTLASPRDGDVGPIRPELWWDNLGGAGLQVVEWQMGYGEVWTDTHLYFVDDNSSRLHTREVARFAGVPGWRYRWRVWSLGNEGETKISPWRTFVTGR